MTTTQASIRKVDVPSLLLLTVGLACGTLGLWLCWHGAHPFILIPSIVATITGARHLVKYEAPRE